MTDPLTSRHQQRVEAVHEALIEKIRSGLLRPGDRFVSARALSQRYEISYQTADRLLSQLAEEGYVVRRAQSGTFLPDAASVLTKPLLVFHSRGQRLGSFGCLLLQHLRRALAGLTGGPPAVCWIETDAADAMDPPEAMLPIVWDCPRLAHAWGEAGRRVVLVNDRPDPAVSTAAAQNICSVGIDDLVGGAMAADVLVRFAESPPSEREVPRVIGFDDAPIATTLQLTTVAIPWQAIAEGVRQVVTRQLSRAIRPVPGCDAMGLSYMPSPIIRFV